MEHLAIVDAAGLAGLRTESNIPRNTGSLISLLKLLQRNIFSHITHHLGILPQAVDQPVRSVTYIYDYNLLKKAIAAIQFGAGNSSPEY